MTKGHAMVTSGIACIETMRVGCTFLQLRSEGALETLRSSDEAWLLNLSTSAGLVSPMDSENRSLPNMLQRVLPSFYRKRMVL